LEAVFSMQSILRLNNEDKWETVLARASSIYKRQTHPLVREGAPQKQDRNCQTAINIWSWAPDGDRHQDLVTDWVSVAMWLWLWLHCKTRSHQTIVKPITDWDLACAMYVCMYV
jgi:hypothetical protein